ncbi:thioredoxin family protein [Ramlibacter henchirensis]|uniref:thioredoxin family protein n=1 Tax=Ramlibacter henchirensis TaxID=204072 RepID=UPI001F0CE703|nr:thioredoxin family protein [Ramlibacter henchirensis]
MDADIEDLAPPAVLAQVVPRRSTLLLRAPRALVVVTAAVFAFLGDASAVGEKPGDPQRAPVTLPLRAQGSMPSLDGAVQWLNSPPLTAAALRGKVVLVQFWTYSCINWQRTLPHVRAWAEKYKDHGLVVIGVHTPEFSFEKDLDRIRRALAHFKVDYPVAVDSHRAVWSAFGNNFWPALYFVDAQGTIRHHHFGEGDFERSERVLQQLLKAAGAKDVPADTVRVTGTGSQAQADWANLRTPETYVGHDRAENFASPSGMTVGRTVRYAAPERLRPKAWALAGDWTVGREVALLEGKQGRIVHRFRARDLHLVMGPATQGRPVAFRVRLDGKPPGSAHGADIDAQGRGVLAEHRLHQLVRQPQPVGDRLFEIEFEDEGVEVYAFTFG